MKTIGVISLAFFGVMVACSSAMGDSLLSTFDATTRVEAECKGTYTSPGACKSCVGVESDALVKQGLITKKQQELVVSSFDAECKAKCIPTSCAIELKTCGSIPDGCGTTVVCGDNCSVPPGPDGLLCVCQDGTQLRFCTTLDCFSSAEQDAICGPACGSHGGEAATGCVDNAAECTQ
jgi:hypothetical protein